MFLILYLTLLEKTLFSRMILLWNFHHNHHHHLGWQRPLLDIGFLELSTSTGPMLVLSNSCPRPSQDRGNPFEKLIENELVYIIRRRINYIYILLQTPFSPYYNAPMCNTSKCMLCLIQIDWWIHTNFLLGRVFKVGGEGSGQPNRNANQFSKPAG